jgi:pectate lyase
VNFLLKMAGMRIIESVAALVGTFAIAAHAGVPAFPGAEGFGAHSVGGRGGRVIEVTNLNDSGPGSLRAALEAEGPRIVVFRTGGTIELMTELVVTHPFLTIAGQTAPGGGITLKTHPSNTRSALTLARGCHDVVIRHLRSRPGPHAGFPRTKSGAAPDTSEVKDALQILGARRVIVDHCSFSWATDEVVSTFYDCEDVTIQWCVIAEALRKSRPDQDLPGKGLLIGSKGGGRISVHHNLMVHNVGRNPLLKCSGLVDVVNNVVLAPDKVAMAIDAEFGEAKANFVGNHVQAPIGEGLVYGVRTASDGAFALFVEGNIGPHRKGPGQPEANFVNPHREARRWIITQRHDAAPVTTTSAAEAFEQVLAGAGCTLPMRDAVDERLVAEVRKGATRLVNHPSEVGGWPALAAGIAPRDTDHDGMPDAWEKMHGFDAADAGDGPQDADGDGYTNVEEFLNGTNPRKKD